MKRKHNNDNALNTTLSCDNVQLVKKKQYDPHRNVVIHDKDGNNVKCVNILSWNVAKCNPSNEAPWDMHENEKSIVKHIYNMNGDVVAIQEAPTKDWGKNNLGPTYIQLDSQPSHCGFTIFLVNISFFNVCDILKFKFDSNVNPAVGAIINGVAYVSVHLMPFNNGQNERTRQVQHIIDTIKCKQVCIIGDTNMRQNETVVDPSFTDAWIQTGSHTDTKYTWNSNTNHYHNDGFPFVSRFDRSYGKNMICKSFHLTAEEKIDGTCNLSDHFGLIIMYDITPGLRNTTMLFPQHNKDYVIFPLD